MGGKKLILITVVIISLAFLLNRFDNKLERIENMVDIKPFEGTVKWSRNKSCKYMMNKTLRNTLKNNDIDKSNDDDWIVYFPCTYNRINKEIDQVKLDKSPLSGQKRFFIVNNADQLTGKHSIWRNLVKRFGRNGASSLMPTTYVLSDIRDMSYFNSEYKSGKIYILKKNIQRQKGLKITKNKQDILNGYEDGFIVAQELLQNPYLINGRKINMRFYILFVCHKNEISAYVHRDGFIYYTRAPFKKGSTEDDPNITTGYIDRKVYETSPLTHEDFRKYLDNYDREVTDFELDKLSKGVSLSELFFDRVNELFVKVVESVKHTVCINSKLKDHYTFQLFGADIAVSEELEPQLMEINKGPDMSAKDVRDSDLKHKVMDDIFKVIKIIPDNGNDFIKIVD